MKGSLIALLLALPAVVYSQAIPFEQRGPLVSVTASASYIYGEPQNSTGHNVSLWGWNAAPDVNVYKGLAMQGDFGNYYMSSVYPGQNRLVLAAGPRYNFAWRSTDHSVRLRRRRRDEDNVSRALSTATGIPSPSSASVSSITCRDTWESPWSPESISRTISTGAPGDQNFSTRVGFTYNFFR